jgi:UDP-N-acetyl-D-mannosaminuronate dehydrogenase
VVIITDHSNVNYEVVADKAALVFDSRNVMGTKGIVAENVMRM